MLGGSFAHGLGGGGSAGGGHQSRIQARPTDQRLRRPVRRFEQPEFPLQARERQHAVLLERGRELFRRQPVDLVPAVGDEVEDEAELAQLLGKALHLFIAHAGGVPIEGRRQIISEHLIGEIGVNRFGELFGFFQVRRGGFHPQQVRERRGGERFRDCIIQTALHLVITVRRLGELRVPLNSDSHGAGFFSRGVPGNSLGKGQPFLDAHSDRLALTRPELDHVGHGLTIGFQIRRGLPDLRRNSVRMRSSMASTDASLLSRNAFAFFSMTGMTPARSSHPVAASCSEGDTANIR